MTRLAALFFIVFSALSLWAAPAAAHGGHYYDAVVKGSTPVFVQEERFSKHEQTNDTASVLCDHTQAAMEMAGAERSAPVTFVFSADNHDEKCCYTGGTMCSSASAALMTSNGIKHPVSAPARLPLSRAVWVTNRKTAPPLQPPKLIV